MELSSASLKTNTDDAGECSSSGAATAEKVTNGMSERDICISIFRSQGVLDRILARQDLDASENTDLVNGNYCSKFCKVCEKLENTAKLLICDNCEDAFHKFCCNPVVKRIPVGEWLCKSCLKKKRKIMNKKSTSSAIHISTEIGRNGTASEDEVGSLEFMFTDTEPYISNVRIGDEFQADVPRWSGPIDDASDLIGDPLEMDSSNNVAMPEQNPTRDFKFNPIGNWLQCQQVIEGTGQDHDETICGKWRRAPLFEVQTDNWECFRCVLWNPAQADCSVPQELETVEVMRQLKYIEMLGPRLGDKRR
ncbi:hypothetical protein ACJIZ3_021648 [Penstemon smallii]|uniref:Uncharacterized protein n=1 Tax=Penstemon smallii TaxID=265156 RepID=A0ABD3SM17_9LAMI